MQKDNDTRGVRKMKEDNLAWAIDTRSAEGHGFIGRYYLSQKVPKPNEGCKIALFKTRSIAREHLAIMKARTWQQFPKARVVQVRVTVESI
jgi:hypothetical protein